MPSYLAKIYFSMALSGHIIWSAFSISFLASNSFNSYFFEF